MKGEREREREIKRESKRWIERVSEKYRQGEKIDIERVCIERGKDIDSEMKGNIHIKRKAHREGKKSQSQSRYGFGTGLSRWRRRFATREHLIYASE